MMTIVNDVIFSIGNKEQLNGYEPGEIIKVNHKFHAWMGNHWSTDYEWRTHFLIERQGNKFLTYEFETGSYTHLYNFGDNPERLA